MWKKNLKIINMNLLSKRLSNRTNTTLDTIQIQNQHIKNFTYTKIEDDMLSYDFLRGVNNE
ncbi:MAG: hypothetical protein ACQXXF_05835 [Thermoplasmatota archaeon]|jgi:Leu/Phe-tRNA-protein transferase